MKIYTKNIECCEDCPEYIEIGNVKNPYGCRRFRVYGGLPRVITIKSKAFPKWCPLKDAKV
ncbi:MAG: hypothetical protein BWZ00_01564 [Bacteroidetes bacterium ADurb.BinA174]|nr:MAG: hypothetical protein BWZ00_01564 [Bacteroidetes bacterium ADurb.BinA174]